MLASSFKLYLDTWNNQLGLDCTSKHAALRKYGWFELYKQCFSESLDIHWGESGCDLRHIEAIVLARNRIQHPEWITNHWVRHSREDRKKLGTMFFLDPAESNIFEKDEELVDVFETPKLTITGEYLIAAIAEIDRFAEWLNFQIHERRGWGPPETT